MNKIVVVSGLNMGRSLADVVAREAKTQTSLSNIKVYRLHEALGRQEEVLKEAEGSIVLALSAGIMALPDNASPKKIVVYDGPQPRSVGGLIKSVLRKTSSNLMFLIIGPNRRRHASIFFSNSIELLSHPLGNLGAIPQISRFSTVSKLGHFAKKGIEAKLVSSDQDEFFGPKAYLDVEIPDGVVFQVIKGRHDELFINPGQVIKQTLES